MRSLERKFKYLERKYPQFSTFIIFGRTVAGHKYNRRTISHWIHLIEKDDYKGMSQKDLIDFFSTRANEKV